MGLLNDVAAGAAFGAMDAVNNAIADTAAPQLLKDMGDVVLDTASVVTSAKQLGLAINQFTASGASAVVGAALSSTGKFIGSSFTYNDALQPYDDNSSLVDGDTPSTVTPNVSQYLFDINGGVNGDSSPFSGDEPGSMLNISNGSVPGSQVGSSAAGGVSLGIWESVHYADDMIPPAPKFKFLFKVLFGGGGSNFYYFVKSMDKPKISFTYEDVNFYNFRTKVLTKAVHEPLSITFWDDQTNSVYNFFQNYRKKVSPIASWASVAGAEDAGMLGQSGSASSFSDKPPITFIKLQQIFMNGTQSNVFTFINPRIENFDFDGVDHEDSQYNIMTCQFNYDNLYTETMGQQTLYDWGMTDLLKGGGAGGIAGGQSGGLGGPINQQSILGNSIGNMADPSVNGIGFDPNDGYGSNYGSSLGSSLLNVGSGLLTGAVNGAIGRLVSSGTSILQSQMNSTLQSLTGSGNLFSGSMMDIPRNGLGILQSQANFNPNGYQSSIIGADTVPSSSYVNDNPSPSPDGEARQAILDTETGNYY